LNYLFLLKNKQNYVYNKLISISMLIVISNLQFCLQFSRYLDTVLLPIEFSLSFYSYSSTLTNFKGFGVRITNQMGVDQVDLLRFKFLVV